MEMTVEKKTFASKSVNVVSHPSLVTAFLLCLLLSSARVSLSQPRSKSVLIVRVNLSHQITVVRVTAVYGYSLFRISSSVELSLSFYPAGHHPLHDLASYQLGSARSRTAPNIS